MMKGNSPYLKEIKRLTGDYVVKVCKSNRKPQGGKEHFKEVALNKIAFNTNGFLSSLIVEKIEF